MNANVIIITEAELEVLDNTTYEELEKELLGVLVC